MTASRDFQGFGELQFGARSVAVAYRLTTLHDDRGLSAFGTASADVDVLRAAQDADDTLLALSGGDHQIKIVITRHTHGLPAEFKSDGEMPGPLRP